MDLVLVDTPCTGVRRLTLNRPEKRNALSHALRWELLELLRAGDADPDVKVMIVRGAGASFSAGYDLTQDVTGGDLPFHTAGGAGQFARHVTESWLVLADLATPVIAQVHGYCLAGGSELAACCDLLYVAEDAEFGYPPVRAMSVPDNQFHPWLMGMRAAMEMYLTGDAMSGTQAAQSGYANRAFPADQLEEEVLRIAARIALIPSELLQLNKRAVHRAMEIMGMRTAVRYGSELNALSLTTQASRDYVAGFRSKGVTRNLSERDARFADYRERDGD